MNFEEIVPWGRLAREYQLMFRLGDSDLSSGVLDCGGGPASFTAEMTARGISVTAADPLYVLSGAEIRTRFEALVEPMMAQVKASPEDWVWGFHQDADDLCANRRAALEKFLADYDAGLREGRYIAAELPKLPFANAQFGLAFCSHLLFLYSDLLSADFHAAAALELCRVAREVRVFPLQTLKQERSPHVAVVRSAVESSGWKSEVVRVDYELQRGGNEMLRVWK